MPQLTRTCQTPNQALWAPCPSQSSSSCRAARSSLQFLGSGAFPLPLIRMGRLAGHVLLGWDCPCVASVRSQRQRSALLTCRCVARVCQQAATCPCTQGFLVRGQINQNSCPEMCASKHRSNWNKVLDLTKIKCFGRIFLYLRLN